MEWWVYLLLFFGGFAWVGSSSLAAWWRTRRVA